jgi:hypothetical protein
MRLPHPLQLQRNQYQRRQILLNTTVANDEPITFQFIDLNEIDPTFKPIDEGIYTLKVLKAELKTYTAKQDTKTQKTGDTGQFVKLQLAVVNDDNYAGRRIFPKPLFPGNRTFRALRKIMDATGVMQEVGMPIEDWLNLLSTVQPEFKTKVTQVPDRRNPDVIDNDVDWREVLPV